MKKFFKVTATLVALVSLVFNGLLYLKRPAPQGFALWMPRLLAGALAPFFGLAGLASALVGVFSSAWLAVGAGLTSAVCAALYLKRVVVQAHLSMYPRFEKAFGRDWETCLAVKTSPQLRDAMLGRRWTWFAPRGPQPRLEHDVVYWSDPAGDRRLLCDLWLPPAGAPTTGLGVLYFHGSAWYLGDKDFGTRAFFRHLASQGHVVMDAQYRLSPEVDLFGMNADVRHALAWLKTNGLPYGVDPQRIVLSGASAGGHLALLAAYTPGHPLLTPSDLIGEDLSVHAAMAYYGPADLSACYYHTNQDKTPLEQLRNQAENPAFGRLMNRIMTTVTGNQEMGQEMARKYATMSMAGRLEPVVGGDPAAVPELYELFSPLSHAGPASPPTFLVQGEDDLIVPVAANRLLAEKLLEAGVPVINLILPYTDHGFDLMLPRSSPPAQSALYELDRFLALL